MITAEENTTTLHWNYREVDQESVQILSESINISPALAGLLVRLGVDDPVKAQKFLYPRLSHLEDPFRIKHMDLAVKRIFQAVEKKDVVTVIGDYDVDGVTSTTLLTSILRYLGLNPNYLIPRRLDEGYGLTKDSIARALKKAPDTKLFIALDCGTNSPNEVDYLVKKGIDVLILDHHQANNNKHPENAILINPHIFDPKGSPWMNLCTVGIVFKLTHAIFKTLKDDGHPKADTLKLKDLLDIVALGTIADLVPLLDENRILTTFGLTKIQHNNRPGLQALSKVSGLPDGQPVKPADVAFRLGPRINASGRLSDATLPVDMLLGTDFTACTKAAQELDAMNRERQEIERRVTTEADEQIKAKGSQYDNAIVAYSEDWHPGVIGIVAGKLSRMHNRPTIVLAKEGDIIKGSGRSIPGIDLVQALAESAPLLERYGGHPMAAGITLKPENIDALKESLAISVEKQLKGLIPAPSIDIAQIVSAEDLTENLLEELELLQPFGMHNSEPIFAVHNAILPTPPKVFSNNHLRFQIHKETGLPLSGIGWKMGTNPPPHSTPVHLAIKFAYNNWNGRKIPQAELIDWKHPD